MKEFTIKDMIKRKSFIISMIIILVLIVIGFNVPNIIKSIDGDDLSEKLLIVDTANIFEGNLEILKNNQQMYLNDLLKALIYEKEYRLIWHPLKNLKLENTYNSK